MGIERLNRAAVAAGYALAPHDERPHDDGNDVTDTGADAQRIAPKSSQELLAEPPRSTIGSFIASLAAPIAWLSQGRSTA